MWGEGMGTGTAGGAGQEGVPGGSRVPACHTPKWMADAMRAFALGPPPLVKE